MSLSKQKQKNELTRAKHPFVKMSKHSKNEHVTREYALKKHIKRKGYA